DGPLGGFPGYDGIVGAMTGHYSVNGSHESGAMPLGPPGGDISMGLYCGICILMAMQESNKTGERRRIEVTLYDSGLSPTAPHFPNFFLSGRTPQLTGNQHSNLVPYGMFDTKTCKIMIGAGNNRAFKKQCELLGRPELADDPRFKTNGDRQKNREALNE